MQRTRPRLLLIATLAWVLGSCGDSRDPAGPAVTGGAGPGIGGGSSSGGSATGTGGASSGAAPTEGGATTSGGAAPDTGGAGASAGTTGGAGASAGTTGGAGTAGTAGAGGSPVQGGSGGAAAGTAGSGGDTGYVPPGPTRSEVPLTESWKFLRSDAMGASSVDFDDASWGAVTLPHTWNAMDGQDGGGNYYRGIGWYRRHLMLPDDAAGKKIFLEFDGANIVADVYVNGTSIGQHRGGFARFRFDVTSELNAGQDNVIAVRVSNAAVDDVAPLDADFTFFGGLYRPARLLLTEPVHVDAMDSASPGVYLGTSDVSAASATLGARVRVTNDGTAEQAVSVTAVVVTADSSVTQRLTTSGTVAAGATEELVATGTLENPHLWAGRSDPYVYTVHTELSVEDRVVDVVSQPLGIRWFSVDASQGFFLNGEYLDLRGVNRHQDRLNMGWAITEAEHDEDMALIEEMGATVIRLAHYQHADYFYGLADHAGMVVWAEIPLVNKITDSTAFRANARQQMTELIRQNYNHPSILFWGIGNEQRSDDTPTNNLLAELADLTRTEDAGRLVTYAQCCTSDTGGLPAHSDVVGYNTYYGWYDAFGDAEDFGAWADGLHAARPDWKLGISEYGAGAALSQHQDPPTPPDPYGTPHPEEWQNHVHEVHWQQMSTRPWLWSKIIWNMFDFAVDSRDEGDTPGRNDKGLVSYDRKTRKDAFFWYKANWTSEPMVYITSRRYTPRTSATVTIKVYSNAPSVELSVNGASVGSQSSDDRIFIFQNVALSAGNNQIEASAGGVTDSVTWVRQ